jgi:cytochrome c oxidase accessory protein FixG
VKPIDIPVVSEQQLYEVRKKIHPRAVTGWFAAWRWILVWATQLVFYGGAWLTWNDRQAVLFDIAHRKFYLFGLVFWPQDVIYLTVLLIVSALSLFLFTAVAGRLWCGYACPQTVYTEIFLWIERRIEGDRNARIRLDKERFSRKWMVRKTLKHGTWIAVSLWTGITFVGYFTPIRELLAEMKGFAIGPWEGFWVAFYAFATYGNAGWMREQVCKYMCPYARFQSAMFDKDTLIITYDAGRGEPRGKKAPAGDCVDCGICVQVCPTGIDIRNGLQYECIGCAACIDGCNQVMDKLGRPRGLIRYTTTNALEKALPKKAVWRRVLRPRVLVYGGILVAIAGALAASLALRTPLKVDVIRDRAALSREVEGGLIENVYRLQIMNTTERPRAFEITASGVDEIEVWGESMVIVPAADNRLALVKVRGRAQPGSHPLVFRVRAVGLKGVEVSEKTVFLVR